jgi:hypothetical protein
VLGEHAPPAADLSQCSERTAARAVGHPYTFITRADEEAASLQTRLATVFNEVFRKKEIRKACRTQPGLLSDILVQMAVQVRRCAALLCCLCAGALHSTC